MAVAAVELALSVATKKKKIPRTRSPPTPGAEPKTLT